MEGKVIQLTESDFEKALLGKLGDIADAIKANTDCLGEVVRMLESNEMHNSKVLESIKDNVGDVAEAIRDLRGDLNA